MKLDSVKVFIVSNPPPSFGGRYFVFLKLTTTCGIEGVGEVYAATFGPKVIGKMIEDLFARRFVGRSPFQIESLWRESYGSGFSLRPDLSLLSVISGTRHACPLARHRRMLRRLNAIATTPTITPTTGPTPLAIPSTGRTHGNTMYVSRHRVPEITIERLKRRAASF